MVTDKRLHWGILGTARINRALIDPIKSSKNSELYAIASRSADKAAEYAKNWGIPHAHSSYEELLKDPEIDVIYNSLPNSLHATWSIKAMQMGKHVLCEKPLTTNMRDMDAVISAANDTGRIIAEAFMYRHHPQTILVKQMVADGKIGNLQLIKGSFCYTNTRANDIRFDPDLGGGSLWDVGCYPISYARYIVGNEPLEIFGHQVVGQTGIDLLYAGEIIFPGDVIAQFDCSFISPYHVGIEITGSQGKITVPSPYKPEVNEKLIFVENGEERVIRVRGSRLYSGEVEDIENAILNGKPPRISLLDSLGNLAAIEACYKSAIQSKTIHL